MPGIGISIFLGAVGAILRFALSAPSNQNGFDVHMIGVILMIVGALGLVLSLLFWTSFAPFGRGERTGRVREEVVTRDR